MAVYTDRDEISNYGYYSDVDDILHSCGYCDDKFISIDNLERHILDHMVKLEPNDMVDKRPIQATSAVSMEFDERGDNSHISTESHIKKDADFTGIATMREHEKDGIKTAHQEIVLAFQSKVVKETRTSKAVVKQETVDDAVNRRTSIKQEKANEKANFTNMKDNKRKYENNTPFVCIICDKGFSTRGRLNNHKTIHKERTVECGTCHKSFKGKNDLNKHMKIHGGKKYSCAECDYASVQAGGLKRHMRIHTGEKPFACDICERRFAEKKTLNTHMRVHTGESWYNPCKCDTCGKVLANKMTLYAHMKHHNSEKSKCRFCEKKFSTLVYLLKHEKTHKDGHERLECDICHRLFDMELTLNNHKRNAHSGDLYKCHVCDKTYSCIANLNRHLKIHENKDKKTFECKKCDVTFGTENHFMRHLDSLQHQGIKGLLDHQCYKCTLKFDSREELAEHRDAKTCVRPKKFQCGLCGSRFTTKFYLEFHRKSKHDEMELKNGDD